MPVLTENVGNEATARPSWAAEIVATRICAIHGHNLAAFEGYDFLICTKCGLDIDEISDGVVSRPEDKEDE